ncbi:hypothetical protein EHS25_005225 [Saitozyma podzolica]|uniref:VWFA domain-containing protein n=1 Tax=Saitozyma podzolica TaxID=1890683 RepID=A0A427XYS1_9TREE|nr:hypothetical protein EHS25_005225 [Saitozyma podzolica]
MPLESCMLVLDNSEYMRNGDYTPTRFQAQAQAVSTVFTAKTDSNPESAVGLMTMAGKSPSLLVTPTNDLGKLLSALGKSAIGGISDFSTSLSIAQLALKHRENKNQRQRIVAFVGSPIEDTQDSLVKLGKKLRKNNVLVDIVVFGDEGMENEGKLGALVDAAGGGESHLVSVPPGPHLLSDIILTSPILYDPERPTAEGGAEGMEDGIDPNMDPELAMAIRMSLQEAAETAARQQHPVGESVTAGPAHPITEHVSSGSAGGAGLPSSLTAPLDNPFIPHPEPSAPGDSGVLPPDHHPSIPHSEEEDEEEMLRRAMALSRGEGGDDFLMAEAEGDDDEEDEEAAIARAIAMSLEEAKHEDNKEEKEPRTEP